MTDTPKAIINDQIHLITPGLVAELFTNLGLDGQARFFNHIDKVASTWTYGGGSWAMQLQAITDDDGLTLAGRRVMQEIGEYSHWGLAPKGNVDAVIEKVRKDND